MFHNPIDSQLSPRENPKISIMRIAEKIPAILIMALILTGMSFLVFRGPDVCRYGGGASDGGWPDMSVLIKASQFGNTR